MVPRIRNLTSPLSGSNEVRTSGHIELSSGAVPRIRSFYAEICLTEKEVIGNRSKSSILEIMFPWLLVWTSSLAWLGSSSKSLQKCQNCQAPPIPMRAAKSDSAKPRYIGDNRSLPSTSVPENVSSLLPNCYNTKKEPCAKIAPLAVRREHGFVFTLHLFIKTEIKFEVQGGWPFRLCHTSRWH